MTIKAPERLFEDPWFPLPSVLKSRYEAEDRYDVKFDYVTGDKVVPPKERADIHQWIYEEATRNSLELITPGGSENLL